MPNMSMTKNPMPEQDPDIRNHNFEEVAMGYTAEMAIDEAKRCLNCKNKPCVSGCPVNIRIPEFISKVAEGDFQGAYDVITSTNALPSISGRVCPQETQCECHCVRGIKGEPVAIGRLERFVADWYRQNVNAMPEKPASNGIKVAVVGSGPASLTCASDLAKKGYQVSIFEAFHLPAACWSTVSPSSVCPRPSCRTRWTNSAHWAPIWSAMRSWADHLYHRRDVRGRL